MYIGSLLREDISHADLETSMYRDVYNERYDIDFDRVNRHLQHSLGVRVGDVGQQIYVADEIRPSGVISEERKEWIQETPRDDKMIEGIFNLMELIHDVLSEISPYAFLYRGLHGEVASQIKDQLGRKSKISYSTRGIEFWSPLRSTATTFSLEGIRAFRDGVDDAVVIGKELDPSEVLRTAGDDWTIIPRKDTLLIDEAKIWVVR